MKRSTINGTCLYCGVEVKKTSVSFEVHIAKNCLPIGKIPKVQNQVIFLIIEATYDPDFWLLIRAQQNAKLSDLDKLIRDVWVECCGHLSAFSYKRQDIPMTYKIGEVFTRPSSIDYEYDFGSTTSLKVSSLFIADDFDKRKITLIMQNNMPKIKCSKCKKKEAELICPICNEQGQGAVFCKTCAEKHECLEEYDEDILSPLVNSPRCGVCGYEGSEPMRVKKYLPKTEKTN